MFAVDALEVSRINSYGEDPFISTGKYYVKQIRENKSISINTKTKR
jgi:hypothetical protein